MNSETPNSLLAIIEDGRVAYVFDSFRLVPSEYRLERKDAGQETLGTVGLCVLLVLVRNSKRLVRRKEIFDAVWPGQNSVEEGTLNTQIKLLRELLGDDANNPRFIKTLPGRGFMFLPDVQEECQRAEDAEFTEQLLRGLTSKMLDPAWFNVDKLAGEAHVGLASLPTVEFSEIREEFQASELKQSTVHSDLLPVKQEWANEPPLGIDHPSASPPSLVLVAAQREVDQARGRIRHFEAKIAAIETKITAFQQSLTQAIVQGTSTFRPRDIDKAIDRLHNDKKELEFRRDDWQLNLTTALSRLATVTQQEIPPKSVISEIHGLTVAQKIHEAQISRDVTATNPNPSSSSVTPSGETTIDRSEIHSSRTIKAKLQAKTADLSKYIDGAALTDRQRECFSLKFEYGLRVSAIVKRLGLSRKTVDEHIAAAERRIGWSQIKEKQKANRARLNPGE